MTKKRYAKQIQAYNEKQISQAAEKNIVEHIAS